MGAVEKVKICHLASGDLWAGAEVQLAALLAGLQRYDRLSLCAILYNSGVLADRLNALGIPVWVLEESKLNPLRLLLKTRQILKREKIEILHTHRYKENFLGALAGKMSRVKHLVRTVHGMSEPFTGYRNLKTSFHHFLDFYVSRFWMEKVITVSRDIEYSLATKLRRDKLITIHNGIDLERLRGEKNPAELRKSMGIAADDFVIGSVGRLTPIKGYQFLLRAGKIISRNKPNFKLVLVGDGPERRALTQLARELELEQTVIFTGFTPDVAEVISIFDIFVLSSLHEGISISLLEALGLGVPAVVTDVGGNPEVVRDGETGLLVPPRDENELARVCLMLLEDKTKREKMGDRGRVLIKQEFSNKQMAERVYRLYRDLYQELNRV
jgi:glycosyltransferase involved in cell wall biosynthesis